MPSVLWAFSLECALYRSARIKPCWTIRNRRELAPTYPIFCFRPKRSIPRDAALPNCSLSQQQNQIQDSSHGITNIGNIKITSSFRPLPKIQLHCRHDLRNKSISRIKARFFSFGAVAWTNWPQRQVLVCRLVFSSSELFKKCQWNLKNGSLANLLCPIGVERVRWTVHGMTFSVDRDCPP